MTNSVQDLRRDYRALALDESDVQTDALAQFRGWFQQAIDAQLPEPNAMTLATIDENNRPSARMVLLKGFDERGFQFFTNYGSRKARQLDARPYAALVFWWEGLERQVRIEGLVRRLPEAESDAYFVTRPRGSQIGAWASDQSRPVQNREAIESKVGDTEARFGAEEIPRPPHWGGYLVVPERLEFWQGRPGRMHDRLEFVRDGHGWRVVRLFP